MDKFVARIDGFVTNAVFGKPVMGKIVIQALSSARASSRVSRSQDPAPIGSPPVGRSLVTPRSNMRHYASLVRLERIADESRRTGVVDEAPRPERRSMVTVLYPIE